MSVGSLQLKKGVIEISGEITFQNVVPILQQGIKMMEELERVKVELHKLTSSDSSALALFTAWTRVAQEQSKPILFVNAPGFIRDVSRVYGLDSVLPISWEN